ncbi:hypothetical protein E4U16_003028 [Claviceps sp. LM84 group G4]|nr:hypothetical protein E4U16_003028 [Claviceps sp. LM84 group G4]
MKRGGKQREELLQEASPPIPLPQPLPPIPEVYKSTMTPKLFGKLLERMRKESESSIVSNVAAAAAAFTVSSAASTRDRNVSKQSSEARPYAARSSQQRIKRKGSSLKSQISDPTLNRVGSFPLGLSLHQGPPGPAFEDSPSIESMPSPVGTFPDSATGSCHDQSRRPDTSFQFTLAPPRLSPMEYVRMYMLHQADAQRSGQKCLLPPPQKQWFWTPKWEEFLIIPRIPPVIKRSGLPEHVKSPKDRSCSVQFPRFSELPASSFGHARPVTGCPRLSLHLGGLTTLMPSVMNLTSLGMSRAVDSYELGSIPRTTSRHLSMSSDGRRTSLTTLAENEAWTPSPWDNVPGFFANADMHSARQLSRASLAVWREVSAHSDPRAQDTSSPTCSDDLSPPIDGSIRPAFKSSMDSSESLHPLPLFFGNCSAQDTSHIVSSTVQCKPLEVEDGLTPGRIQSVVASLMDEGDDDVDSDASHSTMACEHSSGILVTSSQPGSGTGNDIDQRNYPIGTTPTTRKSQNRSPRLEGSRRHSLDPHTPIYSHTRHASLESVLDQTAHSLISPSISSSSCFFDDPFFDPRNDLPPWSTSTQQPHLQTPHTPIPDSPTLGQGRVNVAHDLNRHTRDMPTDRVSPPLQSHQPRTSDRTGHTARHAYSSSFALNRAKSHEAFTLLPRLSSSRNYDTRMGAVEEDGQVPRSGRSAEAPIRGGRIVSDRTTALALRDHDTASRLTSAVVSHHVQLAVVNDTNRAASAATRKGKGEDGHGAGCRKTTTTLGSLLAKHGRRRSCGSSSSSSSRPVGRFEKGFDAETNLESTGENQRSSFEPDISLNVSGPLLLQRAKQQKQQKQQQQQQQGGEASGASHASHSTSSSLAGLKEKWRLKTGHARS